MGAPAEKLYFEEMKNTDNDPKLEIFAGKETSAVKKETIKVIAVGGGGGNALNHIISKGLCGVDLLAVNTDLRSLDMSLSTEKIILGERVTKGLGAGAVPEVGEMAAKESLTQIRKYLNGADMVYITAGMGGGTGTGAAPVIAAAAREMGILTVAVVTKPFRFEGARRMRYAEEGIARLKEHVDALIVVPNERLLSISQKQLSLVESFSLADEVLRQAVQGVTDLITKPGLVNVDFADLRTVMREAGTAIMGVGCAKGDDRVEKALKEAIDSPLMECSMQGAKGVLMNITCGSDLGIFEIQQAASYVENIIAEDATFVWGCVEDPEMAGGIEVIVVATGFSETGGQETQPKQEPAVRHHVPVTRQRTIPTIERTEQPIEQPAEQPVEEPKQYVAKHVRDFVQTLHADADSHMPEWLLNKTAEEAKPRESYDCLDTPTYVRRSKTVKDTETE
ncbi:MAG: cell division protein FtsZ [Synergistaceae bacterium]